MILFEDHLATVKNSKICDFSGTDKHVIDSRFSKDFAKLKYNKRFFHCDPCKCVSKCQNKAANLPYFGFTFLVILLMSFSY